MEMNDVKPVELENTGKIDLPRTNINVEKYIGTNAVIEKITELQGKYGYFVEIETNVLEEIEKNDGTKILLRAKKRIGLQTDINGNIGWGEGTQMDIFLKKHNVEHYKDLIGKTVKVQTVTSKKDGRDYLTI